MRKYRADEPKGGPSAKNRIWVDLSREYHRLSGGLLNANQKQLLTKWNNLKFHARQRGKPNPGKEDKKMVIVIINGFLLKTYIYGHYYNRGR